MESCVKNKKIPGIIGRKRNGEQGESIQQSRQSWWRDIDN